jgi:hypothetical protein
MITIEACQIAGFPASTGARWLVEQSGGLLIRTLIGLMLKPLAMKIEAGRSRQNGTSAQK